MNRRVAQLVDATASKPAQPEGSTPSTPTTSLNSLGESEDITWYPAAAVALRGWLKEHSAFEALKASTHSADWWSNMHFTTGMSVRNALRKLGFDEDAVNVWNLDDHYIPCLLMALGYELKEPYSPWMTPTQIVEAIG